MIEKLHQNTLIIVLIVLFSVSSAYSNDAFQTLYDSAKKEQSVELAQDALNYAIDSGQDSLLGKSYYLLAYYQKRKFMYYDALNNYFLALNSYKDVNNTSRIISTLKSIGLIYTKGNFYERAISFYSDALGLAEKPKEILLLKYQIAKANRAMGNFAKAKDLYHSLLTTYNTEDNEKIMANCYQELGVIAVEESNFQLAREYYSQSVEVFTKEGKYKTLAYLRKMSSLAYIMIEEANYHQAQQILLEAARISDNASFNQTALVDIYANLADLYTRRNLTDSAVTMYEKRLEYDDLKNFDKDYLNTAHYLYSHYRTSDNTQKSDYYHELTYQYGSELSDFQRKLSESYDRYQITAADYKREIEMRYAAEREERMIYLAICLTLLAGLLSLAGYFYYKNAQRIRNARRILKNIAPLQN